MILFYLQSFPYTVGLTVFLKSCPLMTQIEASPTEVMPEVTRLQIPGLGIGIGF